VSLGTVRHDRQDLELPELMASDPDGFLEEIAVDYGVSTLEVVRHLPEDRRVIAGGDHLEPVLKDIATWGDVLFIVQTNSIVAGMSIPFPDFFQAEGNYHFFGEGFGGHLKDDACTHIAFIERTFQKRRSLSVHFFDGAGEPIFKIFISRDKDGNLKEDQLAHFDRLKSSLN